MERNSHHQNVTEFFVELYTGNQLERSRGTGTYRCRVRAKSDIGIEPWSDPSNAVTVSGIPYEEKTDCANSVSNFYRSNTQEATPSAGCLS